MRFLICLGLSHFLTGCAGKSSGYYTQSVKSWRGANVSDLTSVWGAPYQTIMKTLLILIAALLLPCSAALALDDSPVDNKSTYHISDNIDLVAAHDIQYEKPKVMIKMVFPRLHTTDPGEVIADNTDAENTENSDTSSFNKEANNSSIITNTFNEAVAGVLKEEIGYFKQKVTDAADYQKTVEKSKVKNRLTIDYNSALLNLSKQPIISIRFIMQGYITGMAHPFRRYRVVNFDLNEGKVIQLSDIFAADANYLELFSQYANHKLEKKIRNNAMITTGTAPVADNFSNWNLNPHGLRITFDPGAVAPYVYGSQSILIPYADIKEMINPESILGQCLEHPRSCTRDNLLTGGFIDEAVNTKHSRLNPTFG